MKLLYRSRHLPALRPGMYFEISSQFVPYCFTSINNMLSSSCDHVPYTSTPLTAPTFRMPGFSTFS